jgi:hypothetical protein
MGLMDVRETPSIAGSGLFLTLPVSLSLVLIVQALGTGNQEQPRAKASEHRDPMDGCRRWSRGCVGGNLKPPSPVTVMEAWQPSRKLNGGPFVESEFHKPDNVRQERW